MQNQHVQQLLEEDYYFRFGDYISEGFRILGKNLGSFVVFTILFLIIAMVTSFIPIIGGFANSLIISPCLLAGLYIVANKVQRNEMTEFGDFFSGFQFLTQLALVAFMTSLITMLALIPFAFSNVGFINWIAELALNSESLADNPEMLFEDMPTFYPWTFILLIPPIYLAISYSWAPLFVVFHKLQFWDAMEASRIMITKKWFQYFIFTLVVGILASVGVVGFCIGILFTIPAAYCMIYAAFADATQLDELDNGEDFDIVDHLIDD